MNKTPIGLSYPVFRGNEKNYVNDCLDSSWVSTTGTYVPKFEQALAKHVGMTEAAACVNGTAALHICMRLAGVEAGDEVIVPTLTFIAPVNTVHYVGAAPVFMDCDDTLNMDIDKLEDFLSNSCDNSSGKLVNCKTGRTVKAIIPVHIFGGMCDMNRLMPLARKYSLTVIEDASEALGARMLVGECKGMYAGTIGDFGVYSFNGNKIITAGGGGMIVSNRADMVSKARYLSTQAKDNGLHYIHNEVGYNYRLPALSAALGLAQLEQLDNFIEAKKRHYNAYRKAIDEIPGLSLLDFPQYCESNYWFFSILIKPEAYGLDRDKLMLKMDRENIQVRPIWQLNHNQKPYKDCLCHNIEKAVYYFENILNIPCSSSLTTLEIRRVSEALKNSGEGY